MEMDIELSKYMRRFNGTFIVLTFYLLITVAGITHKDMLLLAPLKLPIINTLVPIDRFFLIIPWIYLFLHYKLFLSYKHLSNKLLNLSQNNEQFDIYYDSAFVQRTNTSHDKIIIDLYKLFFITLTVVLPIFLLITILISFLPYHSELHTWSARLALWIDILLILYFIPRCNSEIKPTFTQFVKAACLSLLRLVVGIVQPKSWLKMGRKGKTKKTKTKSNFRWNLFYSTMVLISLVPLFCLFPKENLESVLVKILPAILISHESKFNGDIPKSDTLFEINITTPKFTSLLFDRDKSMFSRALNLESLTITKNKLNPETEALLCSKTKNKGYSEVSKVEGIYIKGRDLNYASFKNSCLPKVKFIDTKLTASNFKNAILYDAKFEKTDLGFALLPFAKLDGVSLKDSNVSFSNFDGSSLINCNLLEVNALGTSFDDVNFSICTLKDSAFNGASFKRALLNYSKMDANVFTYANFQSADLTATSEIPSKAFPNIGINSFWYANLELADLRGSTVRQHFPGANLTGFKNNSYTDGDYKNAQKFADYLIKYGVEKEIVINRISDSQRLMMLRGQLYKEKKKTTQEKSYCLEKTETHKSKLNCFSEKDIAEYHKRYIPELIEMICDDGEKALAYLYQLLKHRERFFKHKTRYKKKLLKKLMEKVDSRDCKGVYDMQSVNRNLAIKIESGVSEFLSN